MCKWPYSRYKSPRLPRSCAVCKTLIYDETYLVSEDRLEGERSWVEPSQGTISASGQKEGLLHCQINIKKALTITNLGTSHTNRRGTKTTATVCYINEMSSNR